LWIEQQLDRRLGDPESPLLVSVRSGAPVSMPGMMDTVLNVGMTDAVAEALSARSGRGSFGAFVTLVSFTSKTPPPKPADAYIECMHHRRSEGASPRTHTNPHVALVNNQG